MSSCSYPLLRHRIAFPRKPNNRPVALPSPVRWSSASAPILHIPSASIYPFSARDTNKPAFHLDWKIQKGESWAIVGNAGEHKAALLDTLKGYTRLKPVPPKGIWPFLYDLNLDPLDHIRIVSFAHRPRAISGGGFYDYSARYGAVREEDRVTLRQNLMESHQEGPEIEEKDMAELLGQLELREFLDLPLVALSNGQTRRARILRALLRKPRVLLLDEPLTGLDVHHRPKLLSLLHAMHNDSSPHIIMSLRIQDVIPEWITHVVLVRPGGQIVTASKEELKKELDEHYAKHTQAAAKRDTHPVASSQPGKEDKPVVIDLQKVNVAYHDRHILKNITWTIHEGDRWILQGPNGSGKTTLLSMITGDHPQSYTQPHLHLFGHPRKRLATSLIARQIGISSPELFNAFPRRTGPQGLSVRDAIVTGFEGIFTYRKPTENQMARVDKILDDLGPSAWSDVGPNAKEEFANKLFASLTPGEQSLVLLMRALINEPKFLILDEAFSGMDERMVDVATRYLREKVGEEQSVVWVSHWEGEVPWGGLDRVRRFVLEKGEGREV